MSRFALRRTAPLLGALLALASPHAREGRAQSPPAERRVTIASDGWSLVGDFRAATATGRTPAVLLLRLLRHHVAGKAAGPLAAHPLMAGVPDSVAAVRISGR
jgi:hypothetical protein